MSSEHKKDDIKLEQLEEVGKKSLNIAREVLKVTQNNSGAKSLGEKIQRHTKELELLLQKQINDLKSFIYTVSHDLRSPLITIHGITSILQAEYSEKLGPKGIHYLERIQSNLEKMEQQLHDLLQISDRGVE